MFLGWSFCYILLECLILACLQLLILPPCATVRSLALPSWSIAPDSGSIPQIWKEDKVFNEDFNKHCSEDLGTQYCSWICGGLEEHCCHRWSCHRQDREESWFLCSCDLPLCKAAHISEQSWQCSKKDSWQAYNSISFSLSHQCSSSSWNCLSFIHHSQRLQNPIAFLEARNETLTTGPIRDVIQGFHICSPWW